MCLRTLVQVIHYVMRGTYEMQGYISTYCVNLIRYLRCSMTAVKLQGTHGLSLLGVAQVAQGPRGVWRVYPR